MFELLAVLQRGTPCVQMGFRILLWINNLFSIDSSEEEYKTVFYTNLYKNGKEHNECRVFSWNKKQWNFDVLKKPKSIYWQVESTKSKTKFNNPNAP